jgi:hypothetical protein
MNVLSSIKVFCLINETKVIGILDIRANISVIDKNLVQKLKLEIKSRESSIFQTFKGNIQHRTEIIKIIIRVGKKSAIYY